MTHSALQSHLPHGHIGHLIEGLGDLLKEGGLVLQTKESIDLGLDHTHRTAGNEGGILHPVRETRTLRAKGGPPLKVKIHDPQAETRAIDPRIEEIREIVEMGEIEEMGEMTDTEKRTGETGILTKNMRKILIGEVGSQVQKPLTSCGS